MIFALNNCNYVDNYVNNYERCRDKLEREICFELV